MIRASFKDAGRSSWPRGDLGMLLSCEHANLRLSAANKFFVVYVSHNCVGELKRRKKLCIHACVCCSPHKLRVEEEYTCD